MKTVEPMKMAKSSRHSKLTGDFGEALVLYWLSRQGFECARVDHTGIDLIAADPKNGEKMGMSVKSRSRYPGTERTDVGVRKSDFEKLEAACRAFGLAPYFAIVVDGAQRLRAFVVTMARLRQIAPISNGLSRWRMTAKALEQYRKDEQVAVLEWREIACRWAQQPVPGNRKAGKRGH